MDSRIKQFAEQAGWMMGDGPEGFNTRLERFTALITEEAADEIKRLRQQNAELVEALNHCINALSEFEKDSKLPTEQFQYSIAFKLQGFLLGALDNAKQTIGE